MSGFSGIHGGTYRGFSTGGGLPPSASPPSGGFGGPQSPNQLASLPGVPGWNPANNNSTPVDGGVGADGVPEMLRRPEPGESSASDWGKAMAIASAFTAVIGAIGQAMVERTGLKAQGDALKHQQFMANINARRAEADAQSVMQAARGLFAKVSAEAGQYKAKQQTNAAARGVVVGQGSSGDALASTDTVKSIDKLTINRNAVQQAGAIRMGAVNQRNASLMAGISAGNLNRSARGISPVAAGMNAAMQGIGQYAWNQAGNYGYRRGNNAYRNTGVS